MADIKPKRALRPVGTGKGDFVVPDDFDAPMPEFEAEFYGERFAMDPLVKASLPE